MALIDRIKFDSTDESALVWKYPSEELTLGAEVIVNQSQEAVFVKGGEALDILGPGTHTLTSNNIPFLSKLINLPFGGRTPFTAEIWYVSKTAKRDIKWGTPSPIQVIDPQLGFPISIRSFGLWGIRVIDSRSFMLQLVGSMPEADSDKVDRFFIGLINQHLATVLAKAVTANEISIFSINAILADLSSLVAKAVEGELLRFGIELVNFDIRSINIPEEEMSTIQEVLKKKMEAKELSSIEIDQGYATVKSFEIMKAAAENPSDGGGAVGGMLAAGIGLGAGLPLGQELGQKVNLSPTSEKGHAENEVKDKLRQLKELFDEGLISKVQFEEKQRNLLDEL